MSEAYEVRVKAARAAQELGALYLEKNELQSSLDASLNALDLFEALFDEGYFEHLIEIACVEHCFATALWYADEKEAAKEEARRALRFFTELVNEWRRAELSQALEAASSQLQSMGGDNEVSSPDFQKAIHLYQKSIAATQRGDLSAAKFLLLTAQDTFAASLKEQFLEEAARMVAIINNDLGALYIEENNLAEAKECFLFGKEVLDELRQRCKRFDVVEVLSLVEHNLADINRSTESYAEALAGYERSQQIREALLTRCDRLELLEAYARSQYSAGMCHSYLGDKEQALRLQEAAKKNYYNLITNGRKELAHYINVIDQNIKTINA